MEIILLACLGYGNGVNNILGAFGSLWMEKSRLGPAVCGLICIEIPRTSTKQYMNIAKINIHIFSSTKLWKKYNSYFKLFASNQACILRIKF